MKWIIDDLKSAFAQLKQGSTWLVIGLIALFALLAFSVGHFALKTDSVLLFLRHTAGACREMTNGIIIFLFCGMIFFLLTSLLTLGELQRFFYLKQRSIHWQARQALFWGIGWGVTAISIAIAALVFFMSYCR